MLRICLRCSARSVLKTTTLSMRFMNSGVNFFFAACCAVSSIFLSSLSSTTVTPPPKPSPPPSVRAIISPPPRFEVSTITHWLRSTLRLSPSVSVALSRMPSRSCQRASDAFSISSKSRMESLSLSVCHWFRASCVRRGWVSRWPR